MKRLNFKILLLITLLSGICFKVSATKEGKALVEYKPNNEVAKNQEIIEHKKNNGILTTTKKESKEDQGKIYNLIIKDTSNNSSTYEEKIYFDYILKILENEINVGNIFKNLNIDKNNGNIYVSFEATFPNEKKLFNKISEFLNKNLISNDIETTKENLKKTIKKYNLKDMKTDKNKILDEEIKKLNNYQEEIENEYNFNNPIKDFFGVNSMFTGIEKIFNNSFFANSLFAPIKNNELDEIKREVKKEEKEKEKNDIKNKITEKKSKIFELRDKETEIENINKLIDNIKSLNSDGQYKKILKSISSITENKN